MSLTLQSEWRMFNVSINGGGTGSGHGRSEQQNRHVVRIRTRNRHTCQVSTVLNSESNKTNEIMSLFR